MIADTLILKRFDVNSSSTAEVIIDIVARKSGFWAFIFSKLGLDVTTYFKCTREKVEYKSSSLFGEDSIIIPLSQVTGIHGGYKKPIGFLIFAGVFFLAGLRAGDAFFIFIVSVFIPMILIVFYLMNRSMYLGVQNGGDKIHGLKFKRGFVEDSDIDYQDLKNATNALNIATLVANK